MFFQKNLQGVGYLWSDDWNDFLIKMTKGIGGFCGVLDLPVQYQFTAKKYFRKG